MMDNQKNEVKLNRTMTPGQMEMIAIGGTIGSGLSWEPHQLLNGLVLLSY